MSATALTHIVFDAEGRPWVDDTNVKVIEVVVSKMASGYSPEEMHEHYPHLSLAQIHAALTYYYDHQAEIDAQIQGDLKEVEAARAAQGRDTPVHRKLRAAGKLP